MNKKQTGIIILGIVLAVLVVFLPRHAHFDMTGGDRYTYFDLKVPLLTQVFLLLVVAAITALGAWSNRTKA